ncbi:MAG TPA: ABC transporter substrate-binding protein [Xanthobacteraceae bacterium]|nr:ABC transporter substrate-binding protein [Xanthobacteraceae bacterium]
MNSTHMLPNRRHLLAGAAATAATVAAPTILRAQGGPLKVGVILPRSGFEAGIGQDCQRGVDIAPGVLKALGMPELTIINGDTESNVDTAREHAEKLINDGAQLLIGAFDSGQTTAVAQVAEQKGIPLVINVASATQITEQGYKFVVRNFPTAPMLLNDELSSQKDIFALAGVSPKTAVFMHVNDLFGTQMSQGIHKMMPDYNLPYTIVDEISYDPAARDLSVEVTKAKATNAEIMVVVGRLNDAMLLTREMIKQRWTPQAILSMGPGWYENQYTKTLGKMSDGPLSLVPWYDPNKKLSQMLEAALAKAYPDFNLNTNHVFTFEALLVAADAYKRAGSADPKALAEALHATNITDNSTIGPGIKFDAKGQNTGVKCGVVQNRGGKQVTVAPKEAANAKLEWPMKPYQDRA